MNWQAKLRVSRIMSALDANRSTKRKKSGCGFASRCVCYIIPQSFSDAANARCWPSSPGPANLRAATAGAARRAADREGLVLVTAAVGHRFIKCWQRAECFLQEYQKLREQEFETGALMAAASGSWPRTTYRRRHRHFRNWRPNPQLPSIHFGRCCDRHTKPCPKLRSSPTKWTTSPSTSCL